MKIAFFGDSLTAGKPGASYLEILGDLLPDHELLNYGRGGDAVADTQQLIGGLKPGLQYDMAFLWTGTNDVFMKVSATFTMLRTLRGQARTSSTDRFGNTYRATLEELTTRAGRVFTVSPWFVGEDMSNPWNRELDELSAVIERLSFRYDDVSFIDLRAMFCSRLARKSTSDYVARGVAGIGRDLMTLHDLDQVNQRASERGLFYTLDGTHLNGRGAEIIARIFAGTVTGTKA
jgi:lysophospholipase L1-like esterase